MVFTQSYPEYMKRSAPVARALQAFEAENASGVRATLSWFVCCSFDVGLLLSAFVWVWVCVCVEAPLCSWDLCLDSIFSSERCLRICAGWVCFPAHWLRRLSRSAVSSELRQVG